MRINKIEAELREYIEKYNNVKIELTEQLDGKSDMARAVQFDMESTLNVLKEQVHVQQQHLSLAKKELNDKDAQLKKINDELNRFKQLLS